MRSDDPLWSTHGATNVTGDDRPVSTMYKGRSVGVVITAYREGETIGKVIESVPAFVDRIYVVDDASPGDCWDVIRRTVARLEESTEANRVVADGGDGRIVTIRHEENTGYGGTVKTGYERAAADGMDVIAVVNGDGQMDPAILDRIVDPVATGTAAYAKGNRLVASESRKSMPNLRLAGNVALSTLSKFATGYWGLTDPQNGYTAISREAVETLHLDAITDEVGFLNHLLTHLNVAGCRVVDVPMTAVYGDEESSIRYPSFVRRVSVLLLRSFLWRLGSRDGSRRIHTVPALYAGGSAGVACGLAGIGRSLARRLRGRRRRSDDRPAPDRDVGNSPSSTNGTGGFASVVAVLAGAVAFGIAVWLDARENASLAARTRAKSPESGPIERAADGKDTGESTAAVETEPARDRKSNAGEVISGGSEASDAEPTDSEPADAEPA